MCCINSTACGSFCRKKKKNKGKKEVKPSHKSCSLQDENGNLQLDKLQEQQLQVLRGIQTAASHKEREALLQAQQSELFRLVQDITEKVEADTAAQLNALFERQIADISKEHQSKTEELQRAHTEEKRARENFPSTETSLLSQVDQLSAQLKIFTELKRRVEQANMRKHLQEHIQDCGTPGEFWEQELESLLFVIELKNMRLLEDSKKLIHMEDLVERNRSLEDQMVRVLQQKEELQVRNVDYQALIQKLSMEQKSLQRALEKTLLQGQRDTQDKEELVYMLQNKEACPTFHLPSVVT